MAGRFSKLERPSASADAAPKPAAAPPEVAQSLPGQDAVAPAADHAGDPYSLFLNQADVEFFTGNFRDALRDYSRALQQRNEQVYPWIGQISALISLKNYREAELWSNRALDQFPEDNALLSQRARVLAATGNIKRALGVSDYALTKGASEWTWLARGEVLLEANDSNALMCFEKAMEQVPRDNWRVPLIAGLTYVRKRQWANAEDFLRRALDANSRNFFIWYLMATVLLELSHTDRAQDAIRRCLQLNPGFRAARDVETKLYRQPLWKRVMGWMKR